jgi:hypothetical protein
MRIFRDLRTRTFAKRGVAFAAAVGVLVCGVVPAHAWWRGGVWCGPGPCWGYPYYTPPVVVEPSPPPVVIQPSPPPVVVQPSPPPVVVQPPAPQVYVQPDDRTAYYYCESAKGYYPYVKECPQGWTRVAPQPTSGGAAR